MIKSMTGFASVTREDDRATVLVTIRALNHRYLDLQLRAPQSLAAVEPAVRALVSRRVARGRVELSLSLQWWSLLMVKKIPKIIENIKLKQLLTPKMIMEQCMKF